MIEILAAILRDTPRLEGSLCRNRSDLFDAEQADADERQYAIDSAKRLCRKCPARIPCGEWAATQKRLTGIVAGRLHFHHQINREMAS